jgi:16S rRNA (cytosine1402-N4)-methyltransferase
MNVVHRPVLIGEVLDLLAPASGDRLLIDATVGEGGHSVGFLQRFPGIRVVGLDADPAMLERARQRLSPWEGRFELKHHWFDDYMQAVSPAGSHRILADLGVSMFHFRHAGRGFTYQGDEPLDMRLNPEDPRTAADVVNSYSESDLADAIYAYGEERYSRRVAAAIVRERESRPILTSDRLADIVRGAVPGAYRHGRIHPATRTFQALRIVVNDELGRLRRLIPAALNAIEIGGRLGIISFHSLEDRIVKHMFREVSQDGPFRVITKKPVIASESERADNPASRSAKFRVIERLGQHDGDSAGAA